MTDTPLAQIRNFAQSAISRLTYMSIAETITERVEEGRLILVPPLLPGKHERVVYATSELYGEILAGATSRQGCNAWRIGLLRNDLDAFSAGKLITVGYGRERTCRLKRLDPLHDEVWELRSRDPKPGVRVFMRFAMPDVVVATHIAWRSKLGGQSDSEWAREINHCKAIWRQLFASYNPHTGSVIHDYISENVVEAGKLP